MGTHRTWDESRSPQWRYFQEKEATVKRGNRKTAARLRREESEKISHTKNENDKWKDINSELKKEQQKNDDTQSTTQLSTEPKTQERTRPKHRRIQENDTERTSTVQG